MINRRGFLQGVFGGVTAAGVIVAASPEDVAAFASPVGSPVTLQQPTFSAYVTPGQELYNADGQIVAIVQNVTMQRDKIEVTTYSSLSPEYILGQLTIDIRARGVPHEGLAVDKQVRCPYCRSRRHPSLPCCQCGAGPL